MIWWTGLAPWEFELPFPGSLTSTFLALSILSLLAAPLITPLLSEHLRLIKPVLSDPIQTKTQARGNIQGYLTHNKELPPRTLQKDYA